MRHVKPSPKVSKVQKNHRKLSRLPTLKKNILTRKTFLRHQQLVLDRYEKEGNEN